ncbi:hypothetical protein D9611_009067 [Ephemerocybe angulata]|uniref:Uncharacterized protein n=1 Tax=Ephemerocybe angulata TaxID=980116 RepID=A0A8H5FK84_9AGAR|nr:hypothetical protein D9611_009067 [Tulosesus angulatus]
MKPREALFKKDGYEVTFSGSVDYAIVEYVPDQAGDHRARLVGPDPFVEEYVYQVAEGRLFLVEAKRQPAGKTSLGSFIPEAVTQAMVVLSNSKEDTVRFCLSDGEKFIFFILKRENSSYTYYRSITQNLYRPGNAHFEDQLRRVVGLLLEWLRPTGGENLYKLEK